MILAGVVTIGLCVYVGKTGTCEGGRNLGCPKPQTLARQG